eukprot:TRINITY_DN30028_c0_g1_i1.p1 TRINITY_DN30028_c0_g1~~TRINITY_DN30028_c0_g1_i1.p1  ORF type:complete len:819 (-),score=114.84 TRINITY_DN30028_c0_g1_i1:72-2528(-)
MSDDSAKSARTRTDVGFVGLGAMGSGMAKSILSRGIEVHAFDCYPPALESVVAKGAHACSSPKEVASKGIDALVLMVVSGAQAKETLWGDNGAAAVLEKGTVVILCSTVPPSDAKEIGERLGREGILFVDAPVSGGVAKAGIGKLTIMAGGEAAAFEKGRVALEAMSEKLYHVGERAGDGSSVKMVNQLLAGVHIATAAEAMALGARAGLDTRKLFEIISNAAGNSWMFENRVPHMLDDDYTPLSQLNIFVKDLAIVLGEARELVFPCPLAAAAHQQFLAGAAAGFGKLDDSSVVKVFEQTSGVRVAAPKPALGQLRRWPTVSLSQSLAQLPAEPDSEPSRNEVRASIRSGAAPKLVVLDDDPTGTQTVQGIQVLTEWSEVSIAKELQANAPGFFILTNSRALPTAEARKLTKEICENVRKAAQSSGAKYTVVLRGDSTLRGHYPAEVDAAAEALGGFDVTVICPFFLQGGRYTLNDVHYVASGDKLVPAADTEFAKDKAFGYKESNLFDWVQEKTGGKVSATDVASLSIEEIRTGGMTAVKDKILALPKGSVLFTNAASEADLSIFAAGLLRAEAQGRRVICRTAASFVSARLGINSSRLPLVTPSSLPAACCIDNDQRGGLIMVGSYVPRTTAQVAALRAQRTESELYVIEVQVADILKDKGEEAQALKVANQADASIQKGRDVLIVTSRELVHGATAAESLDIGNRVSNCLVQALKQIQTRPRYLLAKGGITSCDLATKGLGAKNALVAGQAVPAVPVWLLGSGCRWASLPYIVFPGNVGTDDTVAAVVTAWAQKPSSAAQLGWWAANTATPRES